jgi:hypothetical protein
MKLIGLLLILLAQTLVFFQIYGPLKYDWLEKNKSIVYIMAIPITYIFIEATKICYIEFGNNWSVRFLTQVAGILVFIFLNSFLFNEDLSVKNLVCLFLTLSILIIQFFWK